LADMRWWAFGAEVLLLHSLMPPSVGHTTIVVHPVACGRRIDCFLHELLRGLFNCLCMRLCLSVQRAAAFRGERLEASRLTRSSMVRMPTPPLSHTLAAYANPPKPHAAIGYIYAMRYIYLHCMLCQSIHPCFVTLGKARPSRSGQASGHAPRHP